MDSKLNIYDGEEFLGTADVSEDGRWSFKVEGLSVRDYAFRAETFDGKVESNGWAVTAQQPPLYEDFESGGGGVISLGGAIDYPTMTVVNSSLDRQNKVEVARFKEVPPFVTGRAVVLWNREGLPKSSVSLLLKRPARVVKFGIGSAYHIPSKVSCYNEAGTLVCEGLTPAFGGADAVWAEFKPCAPNQNEFITKVVIEEQYGAYVDNFTLS